MGTLNTLALRKRAMSFEQPLPSIVGLYNWNDAGTPAPNEANSIRFSTTEGWHEYQSTSIVASSTDSYDGTTCVEIEALVGSSDIAKLYFTTVAGAIYRFTYWAKVNTGGDGRLRQSNGWLVAHSDVYYTDTWTEYTMDVEAVGESASFSFWATRLGALGNKVFVDKITMELIA